MSAPVTVARWILLFSIVRIMSSSAIAAAAGIKKTLSATERAHRSRLRNAGSLCTVSAGCPIQAGWLLYFVPAHRPDEPGSVAMHKFSRGRGEMEMGNGDGDRSTSDA